MSLIHTQDQIFIAGASGMAGSAICRTLQKCGYHNLLTPKHSELDLTHQPSVNSWMEHYRPDVVVLAAARVGGIHANHSLPVNFLLDNLNIQNNVMEAAHLFGTRRLLFLGSSCIYPKYASQPIQEDSLLTGKLEPTNESYAIAKIAGIRLADSLRSQFNFDALTVMPTNLYGTGDNYHPTNSHVLPALLRRFHEAKINQASSVTCWGSGWVKREFLHADDLGDACVFLLENWNYHGSHCPKDNAERPLTILNVGTGVDLTIRELAEKIADTVGYGGSIEWDSTKPDGPPKKQLDVEKIHYLGWKAKIPLSQGLQSAYMDFLAQVSSKTLRSH